MKRDQTERSRNDPKHQEAEVEKGFKWPQMNQCVIT